MRKFAVQTSNSPEYVRQLAAALSELLNNPSAGGGEVNTAANLGAGEGVYASKVGANLNFKSLVAGTNISLTATGTTITINSTGGGGSGGSGYFPSGW